MPKLRAVLLATAFFLLEITTFLSTAYGNELSVGTWQSSGSEVWRTSFPLSSNSSESDGASQLYYPHSGNYLIAAYSKDLNYNQKLRFEGGLMASINSALGSDSDFDYSQKSGQQYYGEFKTGGASGFFNIDIEKPISSYSSVFYGYGYRINHFTMKDGTYTIWNYATTNNNLPDLDSYYTTIYQGLHFGLNTEIPLKSKLAAVSRLSYSPLAIAQGHGWWNLRDLDFKHQAPAQILDADIALKWQSNPSTSLSVGYRYQKMNISKGWENLSSSITWDKATNIQKGLYIMGTTKY